MNFPNKAARQDAAIKQEIENSGIQPQPAVEDIADAPTQADFNDLLAVLRASGIIASA